MATFVGKTAAYYDCDDDCVFTPDFWTYSEDENDPDFAGEVVQLNEDGERALEWWLECRMMNEYQRTHSFNPNTMGREEFYEYLTNPKNEFTL